MLNNFESYKYSQSHRDILDKLEILAQSGLLADGEKEKIAHRISPWTVITGITLDAPKLEILTSNYKFKRTVSLPDSLQLFIKDFCSGCLETSIFVIDQLTRRVQSMVDITKKDEQLRHLQNTKVFLRDIETITNKYKKRTHRYITKNQQKYLQEKLNISLEKGEIIEILFSTTKDPKNPSLFEYNGFCSICHRYKENELPYCFAHTRSKYNNIKKNSEIRKIKEQFKSSYYKLSLKCSIDSLLAATNQSCLDNSSTKNKVIKKFGFKRNDYFTQQCNSLFKWSKHVKQHVIFINHLRKISDRYLDYSEFEDWDVINTKLFREIITLTKNSPHMTDIFVNYLPENYNVIQLNTYLIRTFFPYSANSPHPIDLEQLKPIDFIFMLQRWSQVKLITSATKKPR